MTPFDIKSFQPKAWRILARSFANKRTASTYLFHGPEGTGRWALAISFAALLNCEQPTEDELPKPCGECLNCRKIFNLNFEGLHLAFPLAPHKNLEEAGELTQKILEEKRLKPFKILASTTTTNIPIELAREIKRALSLKSDAGVTRVVIFYEMEKMRTQSADALLKMIEEPPKNTVLIMIARRPESLLPTIQSRAQKIKVGRIPEEVGEKYLVNRYSIKETNARLLMRLGDNSVGRAIDMIEKEEGKESSERAIGFLLFKSLFDEPAYATLAHLNDLIDSRDRSGADVLLNLWESLMRDCVNYSVLGDDKQLVNIDFVGDIKRFSGRIQGVQAASKMADEIKNTLEGLRRYVHIQGALSALALQLKSHIGVAAN